MAPLRASTPLGDLVLNTAIERRPLDLSLHEESISSIEEEHQQQRQQLQEQMEMDEQSEYSCSVSYVSTHEGYSADESSEILDSNENDCATACSETGGNVSRSPPPSIYKEIILSDQFSNFVEYELFKVTIECELLKENVSQFENASLLVQYSTDESTGDKEFAVEH